MDVARHCKTMTRLQRLEASTVSILGRCPRLSHFAPLALRPCVSTRSLPRGGTDLPPEHPELLAARPPLVDNQH